MPNVQQFDFSMDVLKVIPWYYDSAPNLRMLLDKKQEWYNENHTKFWTDWERDVFNLRTANDFGLNVWSIILNLPLYVRADASPTDFPAFGFAAFGMNFFNGHFAIDPDAASTLTQEQRRTLLLLRLRCLFSDGTMDSINDILYDVFGGTVYALDGLDMTITYVFAEKLPDIMMELFKTYDILPRPSAVKAILLVKPRDAFGFAPYGLNFDQPNSQFGSEV